MSFRMTAATVALSVAASTIAATDIAHASAIQLNGEVVFVADQENDFFFQGDFGAFSIGDTATLDFQLDNVIETNNTFFFTPSPTTDDITTAFFGSQIGQVVGPVADLSGSQAMAGAIGSLTVEFGSVVAQTRAGAASIARDRTVPNDDIPETSVFFASNGVDPMTFDTLVEPESFEFNGQNYTLGTVGATIGSPMSIPGEGVDVFAGLDMFQQPGAVGVANVFFQGDGPGGDFLGVSIAFNLPDVMPGQSFDDPILPAVLSVDDVIQFLFEGIVIPDPDQIQFFDPDIAVGYTYEVIDGPLFDEVLLPSVGDDLFELLAFDPALDDFVVVDDMLAAGETFAFDAPVSAFQVLGIEEDAGLDPADVEAFVTGISFSDDGPVTFTQTPISVALMDDDDMDDGMDGGMDGDMPGGDGGNGDNGMDGGVTPGNPMDDDDGMGPGDMPPGGMDMDAEIPGPAAAPLFLTAMALGAAGATRRRKRRNG